MLKCSNSKYEYKIFWRTNLRLKVRRFSHERADFVLRVKQFSEFCWRIGTHRKLAELRWQNEPKICVFLIKGIQIRFAVPTFGP
jgi:hypothetical protein